MMFQLAAKHLGKRPWMTAFTAIAVSGSLSVLAIFWTVVENLERVRVQQVEALEDAESLPGLTVFVDPKFSKTEVDALMSRFSQDATFRNVSLIPQEQAVKALEVQFGEALTRAFGTEYLPVTVKLDFSAKSLDRDSFVSILNQIRATPGVLDVDDGFSVVPLAASQTANRIWTWATALLILVVAIVALLVSHLIRLAFESVKHEVETLKILGASRFWIFRPLLIEGVFFGVLGAIGAVAVLVVGMHWLLPQVAPFLVPKGMDLVMLSGTSVAALFGLSLGASLLGALLTWPLIHKPAQEV